MVSSVYDLSPVVTWVLVIIVGGNTAGAIAGGYGVLWLAFTTTGGLANPVVSSIETASAIGMTILSLIIPFIAYILVIFILFFVCKRFKKIRLSKA